MTAIEARVPRLAAAYPAALAARRSQLLRWALRHSAFLPALALQLTLSLPLANSVETDEATYTRVGRLMLAHWMHGVQLPHFGAYLSGTPALYPVLSAALARVGGLGLQRDFSTLCMVGVTYVVFSLSRRLFGTPAAMISSSLFALVFSVQYVAKLATYDAPCLLLLAVAVHVGTRAIDSGRRFPSGLLAVGPLLVLAVATKYVAWEFIPSVLAFIGAWSLRAGGWRRLLRDQALVLGPMVCAAGVAAALISHADYGGMLVTSSAARTALRYATPIHIALTAASEVGLFFVLGALGVAVSGGRARLVGAVGLVSVLVPVASQAYVHDVTSLQKHLAFGLFFLAPFFGRAVLVAAGRGPRIGLRVLAIGALIWASVAISESMVITRFSYGWPNSDRAMSVVAAHVHPGPQMYLAENFDIPIYYAANMTSDTQWQYLSGAFMGPGPTTAYDGLHGLAGLKLALARHFYKLVILDGTPVDAKVLPELRRHYRLLWPHRYPGKPDWTVWEPR